MTLARRRIAGFAGAALVLVGSAAPALAAGAVEVTHYTRDVTNSGVFTTCADGTDVTFTSLSHRRYTTWTRDGVLVRERRHLSFDGTLSVAGGASLPYTGVWNRDEDFITGQLRITGGQFRVDLPDGRTLVGAGLRADGNEFVGSGDRFLRDLCAAFGAE